MNKKGVDNLMENIVFILLVLVFIALMIFPITRAGSQSILFEQIYAKQIALIIDKAQPGMEIEVDIFNAYSLAKKNRFSGNIVSIDNNENKVNVKLVDGKGYNYYYFNDVDVVWNLDKEKRVISLKIVERLNA